MMPKIKLFFEDYLAVDTNDDDRKFVELIISSLSERYEVSENYGRIGIIKHPGTASSAWLFFSPTSEDDDGGRILTPALETRLRNNKSSWNISKLVDGDEIPFFVVDTDGISIDNIASRILEIDGNQSLHHNYPRGIINGRPPILAQLLRDSHQFSSFFNNWGLVLLNPNREGTIYQSLDFNVDDLEEKIFQDSSKKNLGLCWLHRGSENKRSIFHPKKFNSEAEFNLVYDLWNKRTEIKDSFSSSISKDISNFHSDIIDICGSKEYYNFKVKGSQKTLFSIYLRKVGKKPSRINSRICKEFSSTIPTLENAGIRFFEFGRNNPD